MKTLLIPFLLLAVYSDSASENHFFHYFKGTLKVGTGEKVPIQGPIFVEFQDNANVTVIAGMFKGTAAFVFAGEIQKVINGSTINIQAKCSEGAWKFTPMKMDGMISITGTWKNATYIQHCRDVESEITYEIEAIGEYSRLPFYSPEEAGKRAVMTVGTGRDVFPVSSHVLNFAIFGYPYITEMSCEAYLNYWGKAVNEPQPGFVIAGKDGKHCAIFDHEGDKFIQVNAQEQKVTIHSNIDLDRYFPYGYIIKDYPE